MKKYYINYLRSLIVFVFKKIKIKFLGSYATIELNRSDSDNGNYLRAVKKIVKDQRKIGNFKRNSDYRDILEHVSYELGSEYLKILENRNDLVFQNLKKLEINDLVGRPIQYSYGSYTLSPTTLRYGKVASDLAMYFGKLDDFDVVEIGAGYGGQSLILDSFFRINSFTLIDLRDVLNLVEKYLDQHNLSSQYLTKTLNQMSKSSKFDLVISNYAFSELPRDLQLRYIEKILGNSSRGYLTMNSGLDFSARSHNKLSLNDLKNLLPKFEVVEENPLSSPDNYLIVWGH